MAKKYRVLLLVIGILILFCVMNISYAYFVVQSSQSNNNLAASDCFKLNFTDKNDIDLQSAIPISDDEALDLIPYEFTIKNVCKSAARYYVNIEKINGSTLDESFIKYKLNDNIPLILGNIEDNETLVNENAFTSRTVDTNILLGGEERNFSLRLYLDEDATIDAANKYYYSKVVVISNLEKNPFVDIAVNLGEDAYGTNMLSVVEGREIGELPVVQRDGYEVVGWYSTPDFLEGTGLSVNSIVTRSLRTIYPKYAEAYYNLDFNLNGGVFLEDQENVQLKMGETYNLKTPKKKGNKFEGWTVESGRNTTVNDNVVTMGAEDSVVKANFRAITHNLEVRDSYGCDGNYSVDYENEYELCTPTREGYTFGGWNVDASEGYIEDNKFIMKDSDSVVYPTWIINDYKWIVYHNKMNINGKNYTLFETETGTGPYHSTFSGTVKTYTGFTSPISISKTIEVDALAGSNDTVTRNIINYDYFRNKYNLKILTNNGNVTGVSGESNIPLYYEQEYTIPSASRTGYSLAYWINETTNERLGNVFIQDDKANIIKPMWNPNTYTVTFNLNGGDSISQNTKSVTYDSPYGELPVPLRSRYSFQGWYTDTSFTTEVKSSDIYTIIGNQTLYAKWLGDDYTITFNNNGGGGEMETVTFVYGNSVTLPANQFVKEEYHLKGWSTNPNSKTIEYTDQQVISGMPLVNNILYAVWKEDRMDVEFTICSTDSSDAFTMLGYTCANNSGIIGGLFGGNTKTIKQNNNNVTSIDIPDYYMDDGTMMYIRKINGMGTNYSNSNLKTVTLHESLLEINDNAFYNYSALTSIRIPSSVTRIGEKAFSGCSALASVYIEPTNITFGTKCFENLKYSTNSSNYGSTIYVRSQDINDTLSSGKSTSNRVESTTYYTVQQSAAFLSSAKYYTKVSTDYNWT